MTRTGVSSPTRMSAWRLSSVEMTGSAWMSARSVRSSALRKLVRLKPPMAVEKTRSSAEPVMVASALPIAESELPPRSMTLTSGLKGSPVAGSVRWTSLLKNWVLLPRSYLSPSCSMSVRSTKMILAWIESCGVRTSSPRTKSVTFWIRLRVSVMTSALEPVSATTRPRLLVRMLSTVLASEAAWA